MNTGTPEQRYLLTCLIEECGKVIQAATKALRFGLDDLHPEKQVTAESVLGNEINDLMAVWEMLIKLGVKIPVSSDAINKKKAKIAYYATYSAQKGILPLDYKL